MRPPRYRGAAGRGPHDRRGQKKWSSQKGGMRLWHYSSPLWQGIQHVA